MHFGDEILDLSLLWPPGIALANHVSLKKTRIELGQILIMMTPNSHQG